MIVFGANLYFAGIYFLFSLMRDLRAPSGDRREISHHDGKCVRLNNTHPKFRGPLPKKFLGAKTMQNLARIRMTSNFDGKYFRNGAKGSSFMKLCHVACC